MKSFKWKKVINITNALARSKKIRSCSKNPGFNTTREFCITEERNFSNGMGEEVRLFIVLKSDWYKRKRKQGI